MAAPALLLPSPHEIGRKKINLSAVVYSLLVFVMLIQINRRMKSSGLLLGLILLPITLAGCQIVGDIFKAGVWVGVILVLAVIGIVVWLIARTG